MVSASDLAWTRHGYPSHQRAPDARAARRGRPRRAGSRTARGTGGTRRARGRRRAAGCAARATPPATGTACSSAPRSGPRRGCRAPGRATRPSCSTARSRRSDTGHAGREPVDVLQLAEVLGPQPVERGAVQLRRAADEVVHLRLERGAVGVVPRVGRDVAPVDEHRVGVPVRHLARQEVAPFEQQDPLPATAPACARASRHPRRCR